MKEIQNRKRDNSEFYITKFVDIDLLIHRKTGFINYTKLCKDLKSSDNNNHFKRIISSNSKIWDIIFTYENNEQLYNGPRTIKHLSDMKVFKIIVNGVSPKYFGTYGPKYLFNYVVLTANIGYYKYLNFNEPIENIELLKHKHLEEIHKKDEEIKHLNDIISKFVSNITNGIEYGYE
jgi:hypothetical protein